MLFLFFIQIEVEEFYKGNVLGFNHYFILSQVYVMLSLEPGYLRQGQPTCTAMLPLESLWLL